MSPSSAIYTTPPLPSEAAGSHRLWGRGCQAAFGCSGAQARARASFCLSIGTPLHLKQRWCVTQLSRTLKTTCFHSSAQPSFRRSWRVHSNTVLFRAFFTLCSGQELFKMWAIVAPYWPCTAARSLRFQLWIIPQLPQPIRVLNLWRGGRYQGEKQLLLWKTTEEVQEEEVVNNNWS